MFSPWTLVAAWRIAWTILCPDLFFTFWIPRKADLLSHKIVAIIGTLFTALERWWNSLNTIPTV